MATTGLWPVKSRLKEVIAYADNPSKTTNPKYVDNDLLSVIKYAENDDKTDKQLFVSTINCPRQRPYECMMATKRRFGKTNGIVAYHGFQSFRGGEVTPEEAHQIGIETAKRMWKDKYEVVITTHLDHESHYHNHFVANSVSRLDGSRFQNHHYDHLHLREISDAVCAEHGKSVLKDSKFWGRNKSEYWTHKNGKLSHRDMLKKDMAYCLKYSSKEAELEKQLYGLGYTIDWQRMSVRGKGWERSVRLANIGFTDDVIARYFDKNANNIDFYYLEWNTHLPYKPKYTPVTRLMNELDFTVDHSADVATVAVSAVFYILLALFELAEVAKDYFIQSHELRYEARNIEKYVSEYHFLQREKLNTLKDISDYIGKTKSEIAVLAQERDRADNKRRRALPEDKRKYKDERKALTDKIKPFRDKLKQAEEIFEKSPRLFDLLKEERNSEKSALERSR